MASPREVVVGWFPTGNVNQTPAVIHNLYVTKKSKFTATAVPHLVGDNWLTQESFLMKAFMNVCRTIAEQLVQFHEVRSTVETGKSEKSGISQLRHVRRTARELQT